MESTNGSFQSFGHRLMDPFRSSFILYYIFILVSLKFLQLSGPDSRQPVAVLSCSGLLSISVHS